MDVVFCHAVLFSLLFIHGMDGVFCHAVVFSLLFYPMVWMVCFVTL